MNTDNAEGDDIRSAVAAVVAEAAETIPPLSQKQGLLHGLASAVGDWAISESLKPGIAAHDMRDAVEWLNVLHESVKLHAKDADQFVWPYPDLSATIRDGAKSLGYLQIDIDMDRVSECAGTYLRWPWARIPQLEIMMVEVLTFAEALEFSEELKLKGIFGGFSKKARAMWNDALGLATLMMIIYVGDRVWDKYGFGIGLLAGAAMYYFVTSIATPLTRPKQTQVQLLAEMLSIFQLWRQRPACPGLIRERVYAAANAGVVWPAGMA